MLSSSRAASLIRLMSQGGSNTRLTLTWPTPGTEAAAFSAQSGMSPATGQPGAVSVMSISTLRSLSISSRSLRPSSKISTGISGSYTVLSAVIRSLLSRSISSGGSVAPVPSPPPVAPTQALISPGSGVAASSGPASRDAASSVSVFSIISATALSKHLTRFVQRFDQSIDLFHGVVHGEGGAACRGHAVAREQRLGAMRSGPHRHPATVEDRAHVVRVGALHIEGNNAALVFGATENAKPGKVAEGVDGLIVESRHV